MRMRVRQLREEKIAAQAKDLLSDYAQSRPSTACPPIPVVHILRSQFHLDPAYEDLSRIHRDVGAVAAVWCGRRQLSIDLSRHSYLDAERESHSRLIIAHVLGHLSLHGEHFSADPDQLPLFGDVPQAPCFICMRSDIKHPLETQAEAFALALLMPEPMLRDAWTECVGHVEPRVCDAAEWKGICRIASSRVDDSALETPAEELIRKLAGDFEVSIQSMAGRLKQLRLFVRAHRPEPALSTTRV
ncbi:MAG: ImmA/IrrE family metallo-endopeptidase [Candidatus Eisenbacteria sp.]|nr:ImmA/IrrE family metallo-endopeptidase [Candidatus Eisenbacteria bacterium]